MRRRAFVTMMASSNVTPRQMCNVSLMLRNARGPGMPFNEFWFERKQALDRPRYTRNGRCYVRIYYEAD